MTIDEAIKQLTALRETSHLKGETVLVVCLFDSEFEEMEVEKIKLVQDGDPKDGALIQVCATLPHMIPTLTD